MRLLIGHTHRCRRCGVPGYCREPGCSNRRRVRCPDCTTLLRRLARRLRQAVA